jgi:hypothetical protein
VPKAARVRSVGHGQVETRTICVIGLGGSSDGRGEFFPHARQALKMVRRRRERGGRWSVQTVYAITSLDHRQGEDHSQIRTSHGPTNLAALRTLVINALRLTGHRITALAWLAVTLICARRLPTN